MRIGLRMIGGDWWIAGIYYISNLVRALRSLPAEEQVDISLFIPFGMEKRHYEAIEGLVDVCLPKVSQGKVGSSKRLINYLNTLICNSPLFFSICRAINETIRPHRMNAFDVTLKRNGVSVLFPCVASMGKTFSSPWLGWAWDFQHEHYPDFFSKKERKSRTHNIIRLVKDAQIVVTSSKTVQDDFNKFIPGYEEKLRVLNFRTVPSQDWFCDLAGDIRHKYELPKKYLMLPNQFWIHKNHKTVFEMMAMLSDRVRDISLVCTGNTRDWRQKSYFDDLVSYVREKSLESKIKILGLIPREDQIQIMRRAVAVIQPSLFEGWSTVVEDARVLGKKIFVSDIPVHREQDHPQAVYFDPRSAKSLALEIENVWDSLLEGPCLEEEKIALNVQQRLVADYARSFLKIAEELTS